MLQCENKQKMEQANIALFTVLLQISRVSSNLNQVKLESGWKFPCLEMLKAVLWNVTLELKNSTTYLMCVRVLFTLVCRNCKLNNTVQHVKWKAVNRIWKVLQGHWDNHKSQTKTFFKPKNYSNFPKIVHSTKKWMLTNLLWTC